jgi:Domain of unknown function (DUF4258)
VSERKYEYCGPSEPPQRVQDHDTPLSLENATNVIRKAWHIGRMHVGTHIKKRFAERGVDMIDLENIIRTGSVVGREYDDAYKNWKYRMSGTADGRKLDVIIALDSSEDFQDSPLAIPLTVFDKGVPNSPGAGPEQGG